MGKPGPTDVEPRPSIISAPGQLPELYEERIAYAARRRDWYFEHGRWARYRSLLLRVASLLCVGAGVVWTVVHASAAPSAAHAASLTVSVDLLGLGLLALGAAALIADRMFAGSATWVRQMSAAMAIEGQTELFAVRFSRAMACATPDAQVAAALDEAEAFVKVVNAIVLDETTSWGTETRKLMTELWQIAARGLPPAGR
jgi:hypothetical protein